MIRVWDYFMRRKGLMLLFLAVFVLGGLLSYRILTSKVVKAAPEYIHIDNVGIAVAPSDVEVPHTGEVMAPVILAVMQPGELVALEQEQLPPAPVGSTNPEESLEEPPLPEETAGDDNQQVVKSAKDVVASGSTEAGTETSEVTQPKLNVGYLIWLTICGIVAAGLGVYCLEQHFMR